MVPPDPQFDHVNAYWRWELIPETPVGIHSATTVGNTILQLIANRYQSASVRITEGTGAGQERTIVGNTATVVTVDVPWATEPDATSSFVVAENGWRFGARSSSSPIAIDVPERIGSGVEISARAANTADDEAEYALSPLTRWVLGQSGGLSADSNVPPAPVFGLAVSLSRGGVVSLGAIGFSTLVNTTSIAASTYTFHYYDEIQGAAPIALTTPVATADTHIAFGTAFSIGALVQIEQEIVQITGTNADGTSGVLRGANSTQAASHAAGTIAYPLTDKVVIVPFVKGFFGTPASGDWEYSIELPNVRLASVGLFMTNALGAGAVTINSYTGTIDSGLRTMAGGQFSFQITGYLAIQSGAAPGIIVDADRSVRDIYGIVGSPAFGADIVLQLNRNKTPYATIRFPQGATSTVPGATTSDVVNGFGLPALSAGDQLTLDVTGVGTKNPGSDLTLIMRL